MKTLLISSIISLFSISAFAENPYKSIRLGMSKNEVKKQCIADTINEGNFQPGIKTIRCKYLITKEMMVFFFINNSVGRITINNAKIHENSFDNFIKRFTTNKSWKILDQTINDSENFTIAYNSDKEQRFILVNANNSNVTVMYSTYEMEKNMEERFKVLDIKF